MTRDIDNRTARSTVIAAYTELKSDEDSSSVDRGPEIEDRLRAEKDEEEDEKKDDDKEEEGEEEVEEEDDDEEEE